MDNFKTSLPTPDTMKECRWCHEIKPLTDFSRSRHHIDGHIKVCKECTNKRVAERKREREAALSSLSSVTDERLFQELIRRGYAVNVKKACVIKQKKQQR